MRNLPRPLITWPSMANLTAVGMLAISTPTLAAFPPEINLSDLDGSNGFVIQGIQGDESDELTVSGAGDVNADGINDVIIGAPEAYRNDAEEAGESYVVFGRTDGFSEELKLSDLDGTNGFVIRSIDGGDFTGASVSAAGDVNADGIDDIIIGAPGADPNNDPEFKDAGESYVVFGHTGPFPAAIDLSDLNGNNGFIISGIALWGSVGISVSEAGDVNADGIDDVIIGSAGCPFCPENPGVSYVVFGRTSGFPATFDLSNLDGTNGFLINGIDDNDAAGTASGAGDVNGDGIDDIIIGAPDADRYDDPDMENAGESYVVFGHTGPFPATIDLSDLNGDNGFVLSGIGYWAHSGYSVAGAGDVNQDGIDDIIIGAPGTNNSVGAAHVVFGRTTAFPARLDLSDLDGNNGFLVSAAGVSVSSAGDVNLDGIDDLIVGGINEPRGGSYVVFGHTGAFSPVIELSALNGTNGFVIYGINEEDTAGNTVSSAGDVNDDGIDDVIIGTQNAGESYVVFGLPEAAFISIDIKPENEHNVINPLAKGGIWVAVLSDTDPESLFDPSSQVDITTVEFGPNGAKAIRHKVKDINNDGLGDLLLRFKIRETGIACGDTEATLVGETFDGVSFAGTDSIKTVGCNAEMCHKKKHHNKHHHEKHQGMHHRDHHGDDCDSDEKRHHDKHKKEEHHKRHCRKHHDDDRDDDHKKW